MQNDVDNSSNNRQPDTVKAGLLARIFFSLVITIIFFGLLELGLRLFRIQPGAGFDNLAHQIINIANRRDYQYLPGTGLFWMPRPSRKMDDRYLVNKDGFRGYIIDEKLPLGPAPDAVTRVVCLGDSVTFGWSIDETKDTYPAQLQQMLGDNYQVVNLGRPGYTTYQGRLIMEQIGNDLQPDILVVAFGWNDCYDSPLPDSERSGKLIPGPLLTRPLKLFTRLRSYLLLRSLVIWRIPEFRRRVPVVQFRENLEALGGLSPRTIFLIMPQTTCTNDECRSITFSDVRPAYNDVLRSLASRWMVVDADQAFINCGEPCTIGGFPVGVQEGQVVGGDPIHPNEKGAYMMALMINQAIQTMPGKDTKSDVRSERKIIQ